LAKPPSLPRASSHRTGTGRPLRHGGEAMSLLEALAVSKDFGGVAALDHVDLSIKEGEILGLIGPNGAGKTTFFNVLTGLYKPNKGEILFRDQRIDGLPPHQIAALGIARTFQNIRLFP